VTLYEAFEAAEFDDVEARSTLVTGSMMIFLVVSFMA